MTYKNVLALFLLGMVPLAILEWTAPNTHVVIKFLAVFVFTMFAQWIWSIHRKPSAAPPQPSEKGQDNSTPR